MEINKKTSIYQNIFLTILLMITSTLFSLLLFKLVPDNTANIALVYILALILCSRFTNGYWYGIAFSIFNVIFVNYFFTYPFFKLNFTLTGYPITFIIMLTIAIITSATTSHLKIQSKLLAEHDEVLYKAEKEKMRANLLRAISHDLRTPLTSIIGETNSYFEYVKNSSHSDFQDNSKTEKEKDDLVHRINDDANWLLDMVENLLSVTRIHDDESSKVNKSLEVVEEIISEAISRFKTRQPDSKVNVKIPEDYILLPMDPLLIEQVIINLLDNAYLHSQSTKAIQLSISDHDAYVSFHVRDFGTGINPDLISTIFDGTSTRSNDVSDAHRGMGIGLTICKTIIEAHNGTITAINHDDGAEFTFSLPKEELDGH